MKKILCWTYQEKNPANYFHQVFKSSTQKKIVPNFLVNQDDDKVDLVDILKGITLVGNYMEKNIFSPNNMKIPSQRSEFINLLQN